MNKPAREPSAELISQSRPVDRRWLGIALLSSAMFLSGCVDKPSCGGTVRSGWTGLIPTGENQPKVPVRFNDDGQYAQVGSGVYDGLSPDSPSSDLGRIVFVVDDWDEDRLAIRCEQPKD